MTTPGYSRTAAARAARTRTKHDRWMGELRAAGYAVVQAGHVTIGAGWCSGPPTLDVYCTRCDAIVLDWDAVDPVPLPQVLHAVNGHVCTPPSEESE